MNKNLKKSIKEHLFNKYSITVNSFKKNKFNVDYYDLSCTLIDLNINISIANLKYIDPNRYMVYINNDLKSYNFNDISNISKYLNNLLTEHDPIKDFFNSIESLNSGLMKFFMFNYLKGNYVNYFVKNLHSIKLFEFNSKDLTFESKVKFTFSIEVLGINGTCMYYVRHEKDNVYYNIIKNGKESERIVSENLKSLSNSILNDTQNILNSAITGDYYELEKYNINDISEINSIINTEFDLKSIVKY